MPVETMASAASRMILSVTRSSQMYQLFQPMWGVRAKVSPQTILNFRSASPRTFLARNVTTYSPRSLDRAGDLAGLRIDVQALGQTIDGELHRPPAGGGDGEQERMPRPHAEDSGPVDPRRRRRLGREDHGLIVRGGKRRTGCQGARPEESDDCQRQADHAVPLNKPAFCATRETYPTVCHCLAQAVLGCRVMPGTACAKQWHTVLRNVG